MPDPYGECVDLDGVIAHNPMCSFVYAYVGEYLRMAYGNDVDWVIAN